MDIRSIAHQTPDIDELAQKIERRNFVTRRKLYDLLALSVQKWVRVNKQSIDFLPGEASEDRVDFAFSAGVQHSELQTKRVRRSLHIVRLGQGQRKFRIDQRCKRAAAGHKLMGKLYPLRPHFQPHDGHTGDVAARSVEMSDKSGLSCIATKRTNYWYRGSGCFCRQS